MPSHASAKAAMPSHASAKAAMPSVATTITDLPNDLMDYILSKIDIVEHISNLFKNSSSHQKSLIIDKFFSSLKLDEIDIMIVHQIRFQCDMIFRDYKKYTKENIKIRVFKKKDLIEYIQSKRDKAVHMLYLLNSCLYYEKIELFKIIFSELSFDDDDIDILSYIKKLCDSKFIDLNNFYKERFKNKMLKMKEEADSKGKKLYIDTSFLNTRRCEIIKVMENYIQTDSIEHPIIYFTSLDCIRDDIYF